VENAVIVTGLEGQRRKIILLLNHVVAEKIMILRNVLVKISWHGIRRRQRRNINLGSLKQRKVGNQKRDLIENKMKEYRSTKINENSSGQMVLLDVYYI